jgi:hypothetical protein
MSTTTGPGRPVRAMWKAFLIVVGQVAHVLDQEVVLDDGAGDAHRVALLEGVQADRRRRDLPGEDHHRDRVHVGGGDAR